MITLMKKALVKPTQLEKNHWVVKYHADGVNPWSKGKIINGIPEGYWQWYRLDGSMKRSGYFQRGLPVGTWVTYDQKGKPYKTTEKGLKK
jgi:antitoxin component YwqK of YwqJK toxin-antitoxin module